jgi:hypothetical protein
MGLQQGRRAMTDEWDLGVRQAVYDGFITAGRALQADEIAQRLDAGEPAVRAALRRLADSHSLVLQPSSGEVLMANPFSAVPTAFAVSSQGRSWWGNCIWDGLGILAMVTADGSVTTACPDCGEAMTVTVESGKVSGGQGVAHFAVPARSWWEDVVFT